MRSGLFDAWWKQLAQWFLEGFILLLHPKLHAMIDWSVPVVFLDKELQPLRPKQRKRLLVDILIRVQLKTGEVQLLLIHIEVQAVFDALFAERMFRYFARLYLQYEMPIVCIALLVDRNPRWRPQRFVYEMAGCRLQFEFVSVKLLDFDMQELEQNENPCALLFLAFRRAQETEGNPDLRLRARYHLAVLARERGYNEFVIAQLDELVEGIMSLPEILEQQYEELLEEYKREKKSPFISAAERIGLRQGLQQGLTQT
ncbi:MAG: cytosolic protein, partial [Fimbriimonadales bacterium]